MTKTKKQLATLGLAVMLTTSMSMTSFAGQWKQDTIGWWYEQDGGYAIGWQWIDGKCYYFDGNGYMAKDTVIDGYTLNADGQWIVDGIVQTQAGKTETVSSYNADGISNIAIDLIHSTRAEANAKYGPEKVNASSATPFLTYPNGFKVAWSIKQNHEAAYEVDPDNMDNYYILRVTCTKPSQMVNFLTSVDDSKTPLEMISYLKSKGYDAKGNNGYCYVTLGDYQVQFYETHTELNIRW